MQTKDVELPELRCPQCGTTLRAATGTRTRPNGFDDLLRRCEPCGIGYSNARLSPVLIYRDPAANVPLEVRGGLRRVLDCSLNVRNRDQKRFKFASENSEDAVTWAVFSFFAGGQPDALRALGKRWLCADTTPAVLIWGVPVPDQPGAEKIRDQLISILDTIGEDPRSRSEPDVVLDYADAGLAVIEVKLGSKNDEISDTKKMDRYLQGTMAFKEVAEIKESRLYQLTRNWRFGWDLASGRPFRLINLGPVELFTTNENLDRFSRGIAHSDRAQFVRETWSELLAELNTVGRGIPDWLDHWLVPRLCGRGGLQGRLA